MKFITLITFIAICFIIFEIIKLIMLPSYWRISLKRKDYPFLILLEFIYMIFLIVLIFTKYWYVSILVLIVSVITGVQIHDDMIEKTKFNKTLKNYLFMDGIVSILLLLIIVIKELLLK